MGVSTSAREPLQRARLALVDGRDLPPELRPMIRHSWLRSRMCAVPLDRVEVPYVAEDPSSERLLAAAGPVLERFAAQLTGTQVGIVLADRNARVVGRWAGDTTPLRRLASVSIEQGYVIGEEVAGTNGIGTALEEQAPVVIRGAEHYVEQLQAFVCVGVPIRHPLSRRIEGVLDLACPSTDANRLLLPTTMDLAAQIERELSERASGRDRAVFDEFMARSRETSAPLVALSEHFMLTNVGAANLLDPQDQPLLWEQASEAFGESASVLRRFELSSGAHIQARCTPIRIGTIVAGVLIEVGLAQHPARTTTAATSKPHHGSPAWTELEQELADPAVRSADRIRIIGEPSVGKLHVAERIHQARHPGEQYTVLPAALALAQGSQTWLTSVIDSLCDPQGTVVIKNIDQLAPKVGNALVELLDASPGPLPLLIATSGRATRGYSVLEDRFGGPVLRVPPLRDRRADIPVLVHEIIRQTDSPERRVGHQASAALCSYGWPGNFRQLRTVVTEAIRAAGGGDVGLEHLPDDICADVPRGRRRTLSRMEQLERDAILRALREQDGNKSRAAAALGLSRSTMYRKLRLFGLDADRALL